MTSIKLSLKLRRDLTPNLWKFVQGSGPPLDHSSINGKIAENGTVSTRNLSSTEEQKLHKCSVCEEKYKLVSDLITHQRSIHFEIKSLECIICGKNVSYTSWPTQYGSIHTAGTVSDCEVSEKEFSTTSKLNYDQKRIHRNSRVSPSENEILQRNIREILHLVKGQKIVDPNVKLYVCEVCEERFSHKRNAVVPALLEKKGLECEGCGKCFCRVLDLVIHKRTDHPEIKSYTLGARGVKFINKNKNMQRAMSHNLKKIPQCEVCGKKFKDRSGLLCHQRFVHLKIKPFTCEICGKNFNQKTQLARHVVVHTGEKPCECKICGRKFNQPSNLTTHHRSVHLKEKPHVCDICGKCFPQVSRLRSHMLRHAGVKPFECEDCGKKFSQATRLNCHRKKRHSWEQTYSCASCKKGFLLKSELVRHSIVHSRVETGID